MIKLKQAVVVEGKYDKIRLSSVVDATVIETGGFRIFSNKETLQMLRIVAKNCGIVIMTDSDFAGFRIRNYLNKAITVGKVYNAYLPDVSGKEKRKSKPSKEGLIGVEGFGEEDILNSLRLAGVLDSENTLEISEKIEKFDLFSLGLSGGQDSKLKREAVLKSFNLPLHLSSNSLLCVLNSITTKEEFYKKVSDTLKN